MSFTADERKKLLMARGVGARTIARLEAVGVKSFADLRRRNAESLAQRFALDAQNTMFVNCSLIRASLESAIKVARADTRASTRHRISSRLE